MLIILVGSKMNVELHQSVKFIGYPSYLQGRKGRVTKISERFEDFFHVEFDNGTGIWTSKQHVEILEEE